ncbi:hypothetical protein LINGRAHAP2_LOCUS1924 [Linum grandiflorum]
MENPFQTKTVGRFQLSGF